MWGCFLKNSTYFIFLRMKAGLPRRNFNLFSIYFIFFLMKASLPRRNQRFLEKIIESIAIEII